jgi:hypothetical protein
VSHDARHPTAPASPSHKHGLPLDTTPERLLASRRTIFIEASARDSRCIVPVSAAEFSQLMTPLTKSNRAAHCSYRKRTIGAGSRETGL